MAPQPPPSGLDILKALVGNLRNQFLIFAIASVVVFALFGAGILREYILLIYFVFVFVLVVTALPAVARFVRDVRASTSQPPPSRIDSSQADVLPRQTGGANISGEGDVKVGGDIVGRDKITVISNQRDQTGLSLSETEQLQAYLNRVRVENEILRLGGVSSEASDPQKSAAEQRNPLLLKDVFISLKIDRYRGEPGEKEKELKEKELKEQRELLELRGERERLTALEALSGEEAARAVLLGLPGAGKSSILRYLAYHLALAYLRPKMLQENLPEWKAEALLPVFVPLARLADALPERSERGLDGRVRQFIQDDVEALADLRGFGRRLWEEIKERGALFLFDGLDEVAPHKRSVVKQALEDFLKTRPNCRAVVTCRTYSYGDPNWQLEGWPAYNLQPLSDEQQEEFITKWYGSLTRNDPASELLYAGKAKTLRPAIFSRDARQLHQIAGNPLLLTLITIVHTHREELPRSRVRIYDECVQLLLIRWQTRRTSGLRSVLEALREVAPDKSASLESLLLRSLYEAAFHARAGRGPQHGETTLIDRFALEAALLPRLGRAATEVFIEYCETANGLLLAQGLRRLPGRPADEPEVMCFSFPHPSFEEYLAARYLAILDEPHRELARLNAESDRWFYAGVFLAEYAAIINPRPRDLLELLEALTTGGPSALAWRNPWLAGVTWLIFRQEFPDRAEGNRDLEKRVRDGLTVLCVGGHLEPRERAEAGRALAALGDRRDFDEMIPIPAGKFWMGSEKYNDEKPLHEVNLPYAYRIGKYPVTVGQWKKFVEATQYNCDPDSLKGYDNHPVTDVSWHDACTYCEWLTQEWRRADKIGPGEAVRLSTEAEWEKAARGSDQREWPWEGEFGANRANTIESGIGQTCAVGLFPQGNSPYGVLDMAGNVWEWTLSKFEKYPYISGDGRDDVKDKKAPRVLRGGSFFGNAGDARCAYRNWGYPLDRGWDFGLWVVVAPL